MNSFRPGQWVFRGFSFYSFRFLFSIEPWFYFYSFIFLFHKGPSYLHILQLAGTSFFLRWSCRQQLHHSVSFFVTSCFVLEFRKDVCYCYFSFLLYLLIFSFYYLFSFCSLCSAFIFLFFLFLPVIKYWKKNLKYLCINDCIPFSIIVVLSITYSLDSDNNILHLMPWLI